MAEATVDVDWDYELGIRDEKIEHLNNVLTFYDHQIKELKHILINTYGIDPDLKQEPKEPEHVQNDPIIPRKFNELNELKVKKE